MDTHSLATLARVSRRLSDMAVDLLWESLALPVRLIHLLPEGSYVNNQDGDVVSSPPEVPE